MPEYVQDQALEPLLPALFGSWRFHLHSIQDQEAFFYALELFFQSEHSSECRVKVFMQAWNCLSFWGKLPPKAIQAFEAGCKLNDPGLRKEMRYSLVSAQNLPKAFRNKL